MKPAPSIPKHILNAAYLPLFLSAHFLFPHPAFMFMFGTLYALIAGLLSLALYAHFTGTPYPVPVNYTRTHRVITVGTLIGCFAYILYVQSFVVATFMMITFTISFFYNALCVDEYRRNTKSKLRAMLHDV